MNVHYSESLHYPSSPLTLPRKRTKSPTALMAATLRAFSTRITKASRADVQKLVLLMAVAAYAFYTHRERETTVTTANKLDTTHLFIHHYLQ